MRRFDDKLDLGAVQVEPGVLAEIAISAISEIEGISLSPGNLWDQLLTVFGQRNFPAIKVNIDENHDVSLEVKIIVRYGINIPDIARQLQTVIKSAIAKTLNIYIKDINISIQGIERGKP